MATTSHPTEQGQDSRPLEPYALSRAALNNSEVSRVWTPVGTVDAGAIADCDPTGLVQMRGETWSLDWWIGAEDRWHYPSNDAAVRQRLIGDSPIIETAMRVPGGDIVQRVFGVRATSPLAHESIWEDSGVVVEIENLTAVPVAVAITLRPFLLDGVGKIATLSADGSVLSVDGRVAAVLSKAVARRVVGQVGTVAQRLEQADDEEPTGTITLSSGLLEGAFVVALPHTAVVRILMPRSTRSSASGRKQKEPSEGSGPTATWEAPDSAAIDAGWVAHTKQAARLELPEALLDRVVARSERLLLLAATDDFFAASGPTSAAARAAELCDALVRVGMTEPIAPLARALLSLQTLTGSIRMSDRSDASVALLHASVPLLSGKQKEMWATDLVGPVARAIHRISKGKGLGNRPADVLERSLLLRSAITALGRVAPSLRAVGQPEVAEEAEKLVQILSTSSEFISIPTLRDVTDAATSSSPRWLFTEGVELRAAVAACESSAIGRAIELARLGDQAVLPDCVDAAGAACGELAIDPAAIAVRLAATLDLVLVEQPEQLVLLPVWNESWFGAQIEAHGLRTRWGVVSFGVRWHGERPAILWEVLPGIGVDPSGLGPELTAPGLDPDWSARGWSGEALLSAIGPVVGVAALQLGSQKASAPKDQVLVSDEAAQEEAALEELDGQELPFSPPQEGDSFT